MDGGQAAAVDTWVEHAGRWTAGRSSRRSFLGRMGRLAVLVAGGPTMAALLTDDAEARVCGQSGVSPKCPTFDCNDIWGYCWYAVGCCAGGLLKKICDCCAPNWPNVHGYCPAGANVRCVVESCGTDPRVQTVATTRVTSDDPLQVAAAVRGIRWPGGAGTVVLADAQSAWFAAVAAPVGAVVGGPVLLNPRPALDPAVEAEIRRLGARSVHIVGSGLSLAVDERLQALGLGVERIGAAADVETFSGEVAQWVRSHSRTTRSVCVMGTGLSAQATPLAAAFAASRRMPLVVGMIGAHAAELPAYLVAPEAAAHLGEVPGSYPVANTSLLSLSVELARIAAGREGLRSGTVVLAPAGSPVTLALAGLGAPVVLHQPGTLDGARDWVRASLASYGAPGRAVVAGAAGALRTSAVYELQSVLNGYATDKLIGVAGQGLPVIDQPANERPLGRARLGTDPPPPSPRRSYWTGRGLPDQ